MARVATTAVERLGRARDGLIRVGCACDSTPDEVDRLVGAVASLGRSRRRISVFELVRIVDRLSIMPRISPD